MTSARLACSACPPGGLPAPTLPQVESLLAKADSLHDNFRLWITAEPHPGVPIGLLQMSIKVGGRQWVAGVAGVGG